MNARAPWVPIQYSARTPCMRINRPELIEPTRSTPKPQAHELPTKTISSFICLVFVSPYFNLVWILDSSWLQWSKSLNSFIFNYCSRHNFHFKYVIRTCKILLLCDFVCSRMKLIGEDWLICFYVNLIIPWFIFPINYTLHCSNLCVCGFTLHFIFIAKTLL